MSFHTLSVRELKLFLDDLHKSVDDDLDNDFRKILFYLFGFTSVRLEDIVKDKDLNNNLENFQLLSRLVNGIELVLTKHKQLLNSIVTEKESKISTQASGGEIQVLEVGSDDVMVFEWIINYSLAYLSYKNILSLANPSNILKSLIISIINLVTTKLHNFRYKSKIKKFLLGKLDDSLNYLLNGIGLAHSLTSMTYKRRLATTVHLFTIINDYDISCKLGLITCDLELKLESYARKLWFVLASVNLPSIYQNTQDIQLVDNLRSLLVLNCCNNFVLNEIDVNFSQITYVTLWIIEHIISLDDTTVKLNWINEKLTSMNKCSAYCLLKLFVLCIDSGIVNTFTSLLQLKVILQNYDQWMKVGAKRRPNIDLINIQKVLRIISVYENVDSEDTEITSFNNKQLDDLRMRVFNSKPEVFHSISTPKEHPLLQLTLPTKYKIDSKHKFDGQEWNRYLNKQLTSTKLDDVELLTILNAVGNFACILLNDFVLSIGECWTCGSSPLYKSSFDAISPERKYLTENQQMNTLYKTIVIEKLLPLIPSSNFILTSSLLLALYKIFAHFKPPKNSITPSEVDPIYKFIITCVSLSTNRDVRLLAGRILPLYLICSKDDNTLVEVNFRQIFGNVSSIKFEDQRKIYLAESTFYTLGELAIVTNNGEFLCALFIKLIDLFGEVNEQHVNLIYNILLNVSAAKQVTPYKLLSPFLPSIAERIVKQSRMFSKITELLGISKKYFLVRTRDYTTPRLLEYYKYDFIQDIADASGMTKLQLITKTLPRIIATYLCKNRNINESNIISVLGNAAPEFRLAKMMDLIVNIGAITWYILLQIRIDENKNFENKVEILNALEYIGKASQMKSTKKKNTGNSKRLQAEIVKTLLGDHILELVQRFSENVHHIKGSKPYLEKVSSLTAIEFLIETNITATSSALGQISTCLQASLENSDFQLQAISCWNLLVHKLETPHLISLFDIIILIIFQKFAQFEHKSKVIAVEILKRLFLELRDKYNKYALYYFSVPFVGGLDRYYQLDSSFISLLRQKSKTNHFPEFTRRLKTGNRYVVQQALTDLINFTTKNQKLCQLDDFKDKDQLVTKSVLELLRTLLDTAQLFKNKNLPEISTKCAYAISVIGALDPNKFSLKSIKEQVIVINDFGDYRENAEFLRRFMEDIVIKSFWASNTPVKQLYSAYSMQKFLSVLKLDETVLSTPPATSTTQEYFVEVWNRFSDVAKSTLTPFLSSKYIPPTFKYEPLKFPYYKLSMTYERWLVALTSNLLNRAARLGEDGLQSEDEASLNTPKAIIFRTCSVLVRDQDLTVCNYLLKYVSLLLVINGGKSSFEDLKTEFLSILTNDSSKVPPDLSELLINCFQSVLEVLDYFNEWYSFATQYLNDMSAPSLSAAQKLKKSLNLVQSFLNHLPMTLIATKSAECDSYERTILYLEKCYRDNLVTDEVVVPTLQKMYSNINDFDSLSGILKKFSTNNLKEKLSTFQYNENWSFAQESFQVLSLIGDAEDKVENNAKLLTSLSEHAFYEEVLSNLGSKVDFSKNLNDIPLNWSMAGLQASVLSGDIPQLERWVFITDSIATSRQDKDTAMNYHIAKGIKFLYEGNKDEFSRCINEVYSIIGSSLVSSMSSSSFSRNSMLINQLHSLYDIMVISKGGSNVNGATEDFILKERLSNTDQSFETQWGILAIHYVINLLTGSGSKIGDILIRSSETARKNERLDVATRCIMKAMALNEKEANVEYAELLWAQGRQTEAIKNLSSIINDGEFKDTQQKAKAQLQYAVWLDESNHSSSTTIINEYTKAYKLEAIWDKPYYDLGKYYSKIMESQAVIESSMTASKTGKITTSGYYEQQTIRYFLKALALGPSFIFEALPKLITIWLDFAQLENKSEEAERKLNQIVQDIRTSIDNIPIYVWYTSITQLLSRIGHSHEPSSLLVIQIISNLVQAYPKYSLWYILSHLNSNDRIRRNRVSLVLADSQKKKSGLDQIIAGAQKLFTSLIKIAQFDIKKNTVVKRLSLRKDFENFSYLSDPCTALVIPVLSNLDIRLPLGKYTPKLFTAFPKASAVTFNGFDDVINVFQSLQKPKQVTIRGSDFNVFRLLLKRDDTRKDAKVVEFTAMINRLLIASNETRKRQLCVVNYSVVPLAENLGVIEFVHDVATMKSVISDQRQRMGGGGGNSFDKKLFLKLDGAQRKFKSSSRSNIDITSLMEYFQELCKLAPPVLHNWYLHQFSDPGAWYLARTTFTRSSAVMSMVGYIIGLGDRHCENILFLKKTGGVLHIDFDCLFEKGKSLPVPEIVPFRLTPNLTDAMGITGVEGSFRIACEATATLLRENEAPLMNILETLLYDPLLDWKSDRKSSSNTPEDHLRTVRRKIRGLVDEKEGLPMNVSGQVDVLIQEASSPELLCQMYGGWAPYY